MLSKLRPGLNFANVIFGLIFRPLSHNHVNDQLNLYMIQFLILPDYFWNTEAYLFQLSLYFRSTDFFLHYRTSVRSHHIYIITFRSIWIKHGVSPCLNIRVQDIYYFQWFSTIIKNCYIWFWNFTFWISFENYSYFIRFLKIKSPTIHFVL